VGIETAAVTLGREDIRLPPDQRKALKAVATEKAKADKQAMAAEKAVRVAARKLTKAGLSLRDAGSLLGLTRQRIHQILAE